MLQSLALPVGYYDLPGDIVFSVPVTFTDGKLNPLLDVTVTDQLKERLQHSASEIRQVSQGIKVTRNELQHKLDFFKKTLSKVTKIVCYFPPKEKELGSEICKGINAEDVN